MVNIMRRVWIPLWMAAVALASCAEPDPAPTATAERLAAATAAPTLAAEPTATRVPSRVPEGGPPVIPQALMPASSGSSWTPTYVGRRSLEVNILGADVIARVTLSSTATSTVQEAPNEYGQTFWLVLLEFRFTVHEYLKGSGGNEVSGFVHRSFGYVEDARAAEAVIADAHDARWDDRESVVFLFSSNYWLEDSHRLGAGQYWFGPMFRRTSDAGIDDAYTVSSIHNNLWLPEDEPAAQGQRSRAEKTFLLDVPAGTQTRGATGASRVSSPPYTPDPPPVSEITLSDLKSKIATLEAEANAGGTDAYYQCILVNYVYENGLRYDTLRGFSNVINSTSTIGSGLPEGAFVYDHRDAETPSKEFVPQMGWFEGATKDLVRFDNVDFRTGGRYGWRFTHNIVTARPLPAGSYRLYPLTRGHLWVACSFPDAGRNLEFHDLTVTAPAGTLHEAFFDPVAIGSAVGADGTNGVIKPADFVLNGTNTTISSLKWESGTATMTLAPSTSLAGHAVDFIALDGSVSLTLSFDAATQSGGALTWTVAAQPWNAGDLLMLRIRSANVIITPPTATPTPTPTAAPTATPTSTPTPAATPTPTPTPEPTPTPTPTPTPPTPTTTEPVTVTLIPRVNGLTFFDIDIQWSHSGSCDNYYVAIITDADYQISFLGFHPPETSSHYVEGSWLYDNVPDFWVVVECRASGDSQEVGSASLRAAHPDNN